MVRREVRERGVNPARAGMIRGDAGRWPRSVRKPRASGDDPKEVIALLEDAG